MKAIFFFFLFYFFFLASLKVWQVRSRLLLQMSLSPPLFLARMIVKNDLIDWQTTGDDWIFQKKSTLGKMIQWQDLGGEERKLFNVQEKAMFALFSLLFNLFDLNLTLYPLLPFLLGSFLGSFFGTPATPAASAPPLTVGDLNRSGPNQPNLNPSGGAPPAPPNPLQAAGVPLPPRPPPVMAAQAAAIARSRGFGRNSLTASFNGVPVTLPSGNSMIKSAVEDVQRAKSMAGLARSMNNNPFLANAMSGPGGQAILDLVSTPGIRSALSLTSGGGGKKRKSKKRKSSSGSRKRRTTRSVNINIRGGMRRSRSRR